MASLKDIAEASGVSVATVSRVLNPKGKSRSASIETESLIREHARRLNYHPNASARALITRKTNNIGVLWDRRMDSVEESIYWAPVLRGLMSACKQAGYECMVSVEDYQAGKHYKLPRGFRERSVDGVVVTYPLGDTLGEVQKAFSCIDVPFVAIWSSISDKSVWSVDTDLNPGFRQALMHLYEYGHRKIGYCVYLRGQTGEYQTNQQLEQDIQSEFGIELIPIEVDLVNNTHKQEGQNLAKRILSGDLDLTAMIMGDLISIEMMTVLAENKVSVPKHLSIVALAGTQVCEYSTPQLSSLVAPLFEVGEKAVSLLVDEMKAKSMGVHLTPRHIKLSQDFVVRQSTGPVPK